MKTNPLTHLSSELHHWISHPKRSPVLQKRLDRLAHRIRGAKGWLIGGVGLLLLWVWLWQWLLSVAVGLVVMVGVYLTQQGQLKLRWQGWQKLWHRSNRDMSLSVLAGLVALGSTYLATAVWLETDQHWLASSILLEGLGILAIGSLLVWQLLQRLPASQNQTEDHFHTLLSDLSHPDPLKRLLAVRQTTYLFLNAEPSRLSMTASQLSECFRLMLDRETEALVCNALVESMQALNPVRQIASSPLANFQVQTPAKTPVKTKGAQRFSPDDSPESRT